MRDSEDLDFLVNVLSPIQIRLENIMCIDMTLKPLVFYLNMLNHLLFYAFIILYCLHNYFLGNKCNDVNMSHIICLSTQMTTHIEAT